MGIRPGEVGALNDATEPRHLCVADGGVVKLEAPARVAAIRSESKLTFAHKIKSHHSLSDVHLMVTA